MKIAFKPFDFVILAVSVAAVVCSFLVLKKNNGTEARVVIDGYGKEYVYPLDKDREIVVEGEIGDSIIRIENGEAFFVDSPCPNKICVEMAPCRENNDWAACMPNNVFIRVEKGDE